MTTPTEKPARSMILNAQYIKDLSFENPGAPASFFTQKEQPAIQMAIDLNAARLQENRYEVSLQLSARAVAGNAPLFIVELAYAGLFTLTNVPEADTEEALLIHAPQLLFPFARRIIADATRDGGFPPLMLEPMDFKRLYEERKASVERPAKTAVN